MVEQRGLHPDEQPAIPVLEGDRLVGSLDPSRVAAFEEAEVELDAPEAPYDEKSGFWDRVRGLVGPTTLLALLAIAGSIALNSDPYAMRTARGIAPAPVEISEIYPPPDATLSPGDLSIMFVAVGVAPVTTASITLDGQLLQPIMVGANPLRKNVNANVVVTEGQHEVVVFAADRAGNIGRTAWQFWTGVPITPTPEIEVTPVVVAPASVVRRVPEPGGLRLAGSDVAISLVVQWDAPAQSATLTVDGKDVPANLETLPNGRYRVSGTAPAPTEGAHSAAVTLRAGGGLSYTTEWTFEAVPAEGRAYFPETGYFVAPDFYAYWQEHGGLALLGLPISDRMREVDEVTGEEYTAQYFERARIEKHPALDNVIVMGRLAALVRAPEPAVGPIEGARFFPETGHNVSGPFLAFWEGNGGLAVFGYPITEEIKETDPQSGNEYLVQYFERSRFEYHPEFAGTPNEVLLGLLGVQVYEQKLNR
jgi:hypothetical protein